MKAKNELVLKYREAVAIAELLETLEGMGGAIDEEFTKEAQRAGQPRKSNSKSRSWEYIQKGLLFLQENQHIIPTLLDINYLMKEQGYSIQAACEVLFKDKKTLPQGFYREHIGYAFTRCTEFRVKANGGSQCSVSRLIELIPILPKEWLEKKRRITKK